MDKLTTIRIKYDDSTYSNKIPIGVVANNVEWDNEHTLTDILGDINIDVNGSIQHQIDTIKMLGGGSTTVDPTLTLEGTAADAKATGDAIVELESKISSGGSITVDTTLTVAGAAADAKVVGDRIKEIASSGGSGSSITVDNTLSIQGAAAEATATRTAINNHISDGFIIHEVGSVIHEGEASSHRMQIYRSDTPSSTIKQANTLYFFPNEIQITDSSNNVISYLNGGGGSSEGTGGVTETYVNNAVANALREAKQYTDDAIGAAIERSY